MFKKLKRAGKEISRKQNGHVLILVLIALALGGIVLAPTLNYTASSLKHQQVHETKTLELYSADSGVTSGLSAISRNMTVTPYVLNGKTVSVDIINLSANTTPIDDRDYLITSTATTPGGGSTTIESYIDSVAGGEFDVFSGALSSKGDISLGKNSTVSGDIYVGGTLTTQSGFTQVGGNTTPVTIDNFPTAADDEEFAQKLKDEALLGGTSPSLDINTDISLGPLYVDGYIAVDSETSFNLTGTVYIKESFSASKDFTLTGTGSLIAEGDIEIRKIADFGTGSSSIIMSLYGDIIFKKGGIIEALIYAPNGTISFDKEATVIGGVVGAEIVADKEGSFTYIPSSSGLDYPGQLPATLHIMSHSIN